MVPLTLRSMRCDKCTLGKPTVALSPLTSTPLKPFRQVHTYSIVKSRLPCSNCMSPYLHIPWQNPPSLTSLAASPAATTTTSTPTTTPGPLESLLPTEDSGKFMGKFFNKSVFFRMGPSGLLYTDYLSFVCHDVAGVHSHKNTSTHTHTHTLSADAFSRFWIDVCNTGYSILLVALSPWPWGPSLQRAITLDCIRFQVKIIYNILASKRNYVPKTPLFCEHSDKLISYGFNILKCDCRQQIDEVFSS